MNLRQVSGYPFALVLCVFLLALLIWLLRSQRLREKYAVTWLAVIVGLVVLGFVPQITTWLVRLTGVTVPTNLIFILAFLVLLLVCIQLSLEISRLEETSRTVAEEVALLRVDVERRLAAHERTLLTGGEAAGTGEDRGARRAEPVEPVEPAETRD